MRPLTVDELVIRPCAWVSRGRGEDIVVSSRIRLARNIKGEVFPPRARDEDRLRLWERLRSVLAGVPSLESPTAFDLGDLNWTDRHVLRERHLISMEHGEKGNGCGLVLRDDEGVAVMVNEEDHLRIQGLACGLNLDELWRRVDRVDSEVSARVPYAYLRRLGYLTSCPSNVGTGLRASVMLHVPALSFWNEMDGVCRGLTRIGMAVRGLMGEGTEASGNMFQISNQNTLGETEEAIVRRLTDIVREVAQHERNARLRLVEQRAAHVRDYVGRAYGVLMNAHLLSSREMFDLLSALRLGLAVGVVRRMPPALVYELMLLTQPGHMQRMMGRELNPEERDQIRAQMVRGKIRRIALGF